MTRGDGGFGDRDFGDRDFGRPDVDEWGREGAGEEPPEGEGPVRAPDEVAEDAVLRHVLDAVRGGDTPDIVPAASSVAGFAEFLAVEAVLDKRWPETRIAPTLERIADLVALLGDPQRGYPVVHLTGTNGKTSTSRMVDALLTEIGLRTGRYTSPHLQSTATWRRAWTWSTPGTTCR